MEGDQTHRGRGGAGTALGGGAQTGGSEEIADYGFSLPSTNKDIQVRYVDRRNDPSSYPHWVITDNTTPKYDACRGLWSRDRKKAESDSKADILSTAEVATDEVVGTAASSRVTDSGILDSLVEGIRNGMERPGYTIDHALTTDIGSVSSSGTIDVADQGTVASDAEDEEEPEVFPSDAAATTKPGSVRVGGVQRFRTISHGPGCSKKKMSTSQLGTARANRLARAAAREAKLSRPATDVSVNISAEAQDIFQAAQHDSAYDVDKAATRVRLNRNRGLRIREHKPNYTLLADGKFNGDDQDKTGSNDEYKVAGRDNGKMMQSIGFGDEVPGRSDKAKETDEADWTPSMNAGKPAARGRPCKAVQGAVVNTAVVVSTYKSCRLGICSGC